MTDSLYIAVSPTIMSGSLNFMRDSSNNAEALFIKFNHLPSLHNKFHLLVIDVIKSSQTLRDTALTAKMTLETNLKALTHIETALANSVHAHKDVIAERTNIPANVKCKMREWTDQLSSELSNIKSPSPSSLTQGYLKESEQDHAEAEAALALLSEQKVKLQEQRKILTAAIDALSQGNPEAINKNAALTQQSLTQLGMASPQIALIMLAVEKMRESISKIGEGIRFIDMVKQRDTLVSNITDQSTAITLKQKQIVVIEGKIEFINTLHNIDSQLKTYTHEYQHIIENFQVFTTQTDADFQVHAQQFIELLNPISNPW